MELWAEYYQIRHEYDLIVAADAFRKEGFMNSVRAYGDATAQLKERSESTREKL